MIYYLCPDYDIPSWGVGMLYYHVSFLNAHQIDACILHRKKKFKITWLSIDVPIKHIEKGVQISPSDILVVPDIYAEEKLVLSTKCRKILFVQNAYILFEWVKHLENLNKASFEAVFYYMPHLKRILSRYFQNPFFETPAFIASYYFKDYNLLHQREKTILVYPKVNNRDYAILEKLLQHKYLPDKTGGPDDRLGKIGNEWKIIFLKGYSHTQVAELMKEAFFFININTHEAFNSSVPEAMAAGCINFTYEAFGPADFLSHENNAFVFNNNYIFDLFHELSHYTDSIDDPLLNEGLNRIRENARETANTYTEKLACTEVVRIFQGLQG